MRQFYKFMFDRRNATEHCKVAAPERRTGSDGADCGGGNNDDDELERDDGGEGCEQTRWLAFVAADAIHSALLLLLLALALAPEAASNLVPHY